MDVEGLLNLEDYVPPQAEKQIAKKSQKPPQYQMDPSFWQIPDEPPPSYEGEQPALEAPPVAEAEEDEANQLLDQLELPNYNDVEMRLNEPEMNYERRQNYLKKVYKMQKRDEKSSSNENTCL